MPNPHTIVLRGGVWGWDGPAVSSGMDKLASQIRALGGPTYVFNWNDYAGPLAVINALPEAALVAMMGYSGGGMMVPWLCHRTKDVVDLAIGIDPSPWTQVNTQTVRAKRVICYHNETPMFFGLGGGIYANKHMTVRPLRQMHLNVQFNRAVWNEIIGDIKALSTAPAVA